MFRSVGVALRKVSLLMKDKINMPYYAVRVGRETGIFTSWQECKQRVDGVTARFKKFNTIEEAEAFMNVYDPKDYKRKPFVAAQPSEQDTASTSSQPPGGNTRARKRKHHNEVVESKKQKTADSSRTVVYSDGCCTHNGRSKALAGIGVFWGDDDPRNVSAPLIGNQTNQRAELNAAIKALETAQAQNLSQLEIRTDSMYTLNAVTSWMHNWKRNGFKTANGKDVKNKEDIVKLYNLCQKMDVKWTHVPGHSNVYGNEKADELARLGSKKSKPGK